jgi:hypothetical protein
MLRQLGVDFAHGYWLGRHQPVERWMIDGAPAEGAELGHRSRSAPRIPGMSSPPRRRDAASIEPTTIAAVPWTYWLGLIWFVVDVVVLVGLVIAYMVKVGRLEARWKRWYAEHPYLPEKPA